MKYSLNKNNDYTVLSLEESKLDSSIAPELKSELLNLQATGTRNLILDLSGTKYIDSSGLSALLTGNRLFSENDGAFVLAALSDFVLKLITISQLQNILNITPTVKEAEAMIVESNAE